METEAWIKRPAAAEMTEKRRLLVIIKTQPEPWPPDGKIAEAPKCTFWSRESQGSLNPPSPNLPPYHPLYFPTIQLRLKKQKKETPAALSVSTLAANRSTLPVFALLSVCRRASRPSFTLRFELQFVGFSFLFPSPFHSKRCSLFLALTSGVLSPHTYCTSVYLSLKVEMSFLVVFNRQQLKLRN